MLRLIALLTGIMLVGVAPINAATITVLKGDKVEKISTARKSGIPHVLRGNPTIDEVYHAPRQTPGLRLIGTGGSTLWLHDPETGHIIACSIYSTGYVGERAFRCTGQ
jgi:hypothetical protein